MWENSIDDKLFDAMLKAAAEDAMLQDIETLPSCAEANAHYKPSIALDKKIRKITQRHELRKKFTSWEKASVKIAASIAVFIIFSSTILLSVEASRNFIFNTFIEWREDHFLFEHNATPHESFVVYKPSYLPDGFSEASSDIVGDIAVTIYQNTSGAEVLLSQSSAQSSSIFADYEDMDFSVISLNGGDAYLVEDDDLDKVNILLWEYNSSIFSITSEVGSTELILIAESIK